jgi:hypothetical protein
VSHQISRVISSDYSLDIGIAEVGIPAMLTVRHLAVFRAAIISRPHTSRAEPLDL